MIKLYNAEVTKWIKSYDGKPFHAVLCDPPYFYDTIVKRFGKKNSKPSKQGRDGRFSRLSSGFLGEQWDTNIAYDPEIWKAIDSVLYPGAMGMFYSGARMYHNIASAIESAGFIIHPPIVWLQTQGFPKASRSNFPGYYYGTQALKPGFEFIGVFQKPPSDIQTNTHKSHGTGLYNVENSRVNGRWPSNVVLQHNLNCKIVGYKSDTYVINKFKDGMKPFGGGAGHKYETNKFEIQIPVWECSEDCAVQDIRVNQMFYQFVYYDMSVFYTQFMKASKAERDANLDEPNPHRTVKPIQLNSYLAKLILPPDEFAPRRLFVPFAGVASEIVGAAMAGWEEIIGVELEPKYVYIGTRRISTWLRTEQHKPVEYKQNHLFDMEEYDG